jgi:hypothetical protein
LYCYNNSKLESQSKTVSAKATNVSCNGQQTNNHCFRINGSVIAINGLKFQLPLTDLEYTMVVATAANEMLMEIVLPQQQ